MPCRAWKKVMNGTTYWEVLVSNGQLIIPFEQRNRDSLHFVNCLMACKLSFVHRFWLAASLGARKMFRVCFIFLSSNQYGLVNCCRVLHAFKCDCMHISSVFENCESWSTSYKFTYFTHHVTKVNEFWFLNHSKRLKDYQFSEFWHTIFQWLLKKLTIFEIVNMSKSRVSLRISCNRSTIQN